MSRKKKRILLISLSSIIIIIIALGFVLSNMMAGYDNMTFDEVYGSAKMKNHFGIGENRDPADYGFRNFETREFMSEDDGIRLHAWYVPSKNRTSKKCIIFLHGQTSNKLKTMKYLSLIKEKNLDLDHACFFPDFRHSGMSESGKTGLGYEYAEDTYYSIRYCADKLGYTNFILYGFSQGAMAVLVMLDRGDYYSSLTKDGISIDKIIFDSPLCNITDTIVHEAVDNQHYPEFLIRFGLAAFNLRHCFYLPRMRLSRLYADTEIPLLILQALDDPTVPAVILKDELSRMDNPHVRVHYFKNGLHVKLLRNNRQEYMNIVSKFIRE